MKEKIAEIIAGITLCIASISLKFARSGRNKYVDKESCHIAMDSVNLRITELGKHIDTRFDDLKDFLVKNGVKK